MPNHRVWGIVYSRHGFVRASIRMNFRPTLSLLYGIIYWDGGLTYLDAMKHLLKIVSACTLCITLLCNCRTQVTKPNPLEGWMILGEVEVIANSLPRSSNPHNYTSGPFGGPEQIMKDRGWLLMSKYIDGKTQYALKTWTGNNIYYLWRIPEAIGKGYYNDPYLGCTHMFINSDGEKRFVSIKQL